MVYKKTTQLISFIALSLLLSTAPSGFCQQFEMSSHEILAQVHELSHRLTVSLDLATPRPGERAPDRAAIALDAAAIRAELDALEQTVHGLDEAEQQVLLDKIDGLRGLVHNLELASQEGGPAPLVPTVSSQEPVRISTSLPGEAIPSNDACANAPVVGYGAFVGSTTEATNDGEASCGASMYTPDVWFRFVAPESGKVVFETFDSQYDTVLSVHSECPGTVANQRACNDDSYGLQSATSLYVNSGSSYLVRVSGMGGAVGSFTLSIGLGARIEGTVRTETNLEPVAWSYVDTWDSESRFVGWAKCGADGQFEISWLKAGSYFATTNADLPFLNELYDDLPCPGGGPSCDPTSGTPIECQVGSAVSGIDFLLNTQGIIAGTVREAGTSNPVGSARIELWSSAGEFLKARYTQQDGEYEIGHSEPGSYYLTASSSAHVERLYADIDCPGGPPDGCDPTAGASVPLQLNQTTGGIDFELDPLGSISGTLTDATTGDGIQGALIAVYDATGYRVNGVGPGSGGSFKLGGLVDGTYFLVASKWGYQSEVYDDLPCESSSCEPTSGTPLVIANMAQLTGIDIDLMSLGRISGAVRDAATGQGAHRVSVEIIDVLGQVRDRVSTGTQGDFLSDPLASGTYFAVAQDSDFLGELYDDIPCDQGCDPMAGTALEVVDGQRTEGVDFDLVARGFVTGRVTAARDGSPLDGVRIEAFDSSGGHLRTASTYSDGSYRIGPFEDGEVFLATNDPNKEIIDELYDNIRCTGGPGVGCDVTTGTPIGVAAGTVTSGIDFSVDLTGSISGSVTSQGGSSVGRFQVLVVDGSGATVASSFHFSSSFTVRGLNPGSYYVVIAAENQYMDEAYDDIPCPSGAARCDLAAATPVSLLVGTEVTDIDFVLDRLGVIKGTVTDEALGDPQNGFFVGAYDASGALVGGADTDQTGVYRLDALTPGTYFVATRELSRRLVDELFDDLSCKGGPGAGCVATSGTPISVEMNQVVSGIDFALGPTGFISGRVIDEITGKPLADYDVQAFDSSSVKIASATTDANGYYLLMGFDTGHVFVATYGGWWSSYLDELYDGLPCLGGAGSGCDPAKGTPVAVTLGSTTQFINFALQPRESGIAGAVTRKQSGERVAGIFVDVWDADTGTFVKSGITDYLGTFQIELAPGTYHLSTHNYLGFVDQVFDGISCPGGSAHAGRCDPGAGTPVVVETDRMTALIEFSLDLAQVLFYDNFESGNTSAWSSTAP